MFCERKLYVIGEELKWRNIWDGILSKHTIGMYEILNQKPKIKKNIVSWMLKEYDILRINLLFSFCFNM